MIIQQLVQNYFERNGNFDGILNTCIGMQLSAIASKAGISTNEVCHRMLGYDFNRGAEETMKVRAAIVRGASSVTGWEEFGDADSLREAFGVRKVSVIKNSGKPIPGCEGYDALIAEYYSWDCNNIIDDNGTCTPFSIWLLKHSKDSVSSVYNNDCAKRCFVRVKVDKGCTPHIYRSVLCVPEKISDSQFDRINKKALKIAMGKSGGVKSFADIPFTDLIMLSAKKPRKYLEMLDYCNATDITYAQLVLKFGYRVPDMFVPFERCGFACMQYGDYILCAVDKRDEGWKIYKSEDFMSIVTCGEASRGNIFTNYSWDNGGAASELHCF